MIRPDIAAGPLTWTATDGLSAGCDTGGRLLVADSWLLRDGRVRGFERHRERSLRACAGCDGPPLRRLLEFWRDMTGALPRTGEWFPRVELAAEASRLRLRLRQAPPLAPDVRMRAVGRPDPRTAPRRKGPYLDRLTRVRHHAALHGAEIMPGRRETGNSGKAFQVRSL